MSKINRNSVHGIVGSRLLYYKILLRKYATGNVHLDNIILSIILIETHFRPWYARLVEYILTFGEGIYSVLFHRPMKNFTIGISQIGIAHLLNSYGYNYYPHARSIVLVKFNQLLLIFHVILTKDVINQTISHVSPLLIQVQTVFPDDLSQQLVWLGELYNGRYAYGLLLEDVFNRISSK